MEKAGMQVAYLELYCNMPALQLMQIHPPQKKKRVLFPWEILLQRPPPSPPTLPLSPWQSISADKNPASPASFFPLMDFSVASPFGGGGGETGTASARACVCARERKKTFLGWCDIRVASCDPLRLVPFQLFRQDRRNDETSYYRVPHFRSGVIYASRSRKRALRGLLGDEYV